MGQSFWLIGSFACVLLKFSFDLLIIHVHLILLPKGQNILFFLLNLKKTEIAMELSGSLIKVYHVLFLIINKIMHVIFSMCFKKLFIKSHFSFDNFKSFFSNFKFYSF